ncbi:MarR family winged helix-turn-helix transcriptional regulator [Microbacterium capsulatum]|uniref:MarR family winged helix-turn-helix transcriptional regulator n=1 Tax=Microbacterium capsulatum TaxID=3041921 RepID=A0ABU0XII1_9MICO|nr:MarR family winged helix-turn-helix transcriptional regulator [Microbacterium sp. ASV81]MDQ4214948.1 MarR family winged helix-turn-helix transcriptional regulator [Microbacterium sp. ASV81]
MAEPEIPDPLDAIVAALARLRGRGPHGRGPREHDRLHEGLPRHEGMPMHGGHGGPHGDPHAHGGPHWRGMPWGGDPGARGEVPARLRMLDALAGGPLSVSAVGEAIGVDQPRASRLVQQGVERGWLLREADPDDARRTRIVLTDDGRRMIRGFRGERREALRGALAALTPEEQHEFARLLAKVADNWR